MYLENKIALDKWRDELFTLMNPKAGDQVSLHPHYSATNKVSENEGIIKYVDTRTKLVGVCFPRCSLFLWMPVHKIRIIKRAQKGATR